MVAPFWSDVDTRNTASGLVYYKITPTYMIVKWSVVGYYSQHVDKLNDFQLIITDGSDPIINGGNNVAFCYGNMDWTTGDASQGVNGFAGVPATVGVNKGDGINFIQLGLFDQAGSAYDGPGGLNDGVSWLDNQSFYFNVCSNSNNIAPISTGTLNCGDTITICGFNDTLYYSTSFAAPEINQSVTITASSPTLGSNLIVTNSTSGVTGTISFMVVAIPGLSGYHTVDVTATDNGSPAASTTVTYVIYIANNPIPSLSLSTASGNQIICSGENNTIYATATGGTPGFTYSWSPNISTNDSAVITNPGIYQVVITDTKQCNDTAVINMTLGNPNVSISGDLTLCPGMCTQLICNPVNGTGPYVCSWSTQGLGDSLTTCAGGTYQVVVTDANGCTDSTTATVTLDVSPVAGFTENPSSPAQPNVPVTFTNTSTISSGTIVNYNWSFGDGNSSTTTNPTHTYVSGGIYNVSLIVTSNNGCIDTLTKIYQVYAPNIITPNGDNKNDVLLFKGLEYYPNNKISIFNRWGTKIYEKESYSNDWNGSGHTDGTYYYILEVPNAKPQTTFTSYFTIVR
jgi:gliding motility-associated-like protein